MNLIYIPYFIVAVLLGFIIHEAAHYAMGTALGYEMFVSINKAGLARGGYTTDLHAQLVSIAGPLITIITAIIALWLIYARNLKAVFPYLFFALMMRVMAAGASIANPNDEARVSEWLGIGMWTLPVIVIAVLLIMTFLGARKLSLGWRSWVFSWVTVSICITAIIFTEPYWPVIGA